MGAPPPVPSGGGGPLALAGLLQDALNQVIDTPWFHDLVRTVTPDIAYRKAAAFKQFDIDSRAAELRKILQLQGQIEEHAGPLLREFASAGLRDFLGVSIPAAQLGGPGGSPGHKDAAETIGATVMGALFGSFSPAGGITPEGGRLNAEKLISAVCETALEGWLGENLSLGYITKDLPNWGDLDDIMARNLGMGRVTSRVLRPIITALVVKPFEEYLHSQLRDAIPTVSEAVRLLNRGHFGETEYFALMARHGYGTELAGQLRVLNSQQLSRSDLQRLYDSGVLLEDGVLAHLRAQGYSSTVAPAILHLIKNDRIFSYETALAGVVRDMFRDREIDEAEAGQLLDTISYTNEEKVALLGVALIERSRPKRLSESDLDEAFRLELVGVDELQRRYELAGYAPADVELKVALAVRAKQKADDKAAALALGRPKTLTESEWLDLHRRGIIDSGRLAGALRGLHYSDDQVALLVVRAEENRIAYARQQAAAAAAARGLRPTRATIEEAYKRGFVDDGTLAAAYAAAGVASDELGLLMQLRREERAEWLARKDAAAAGQATSSTSSRA